MRRRRVSCAGTRNRPLWASAGCGAGATRPSRGPSTTQRARVAHHVCEESVRIDHHGEIQCCAESTGITARCLDPAYTTGSRIMYLVLVYNNINGTVPWVCCLLKAHNNYKVHDNVKRPRQCCIYMHLQLPLACIQLTYHRPTPPLPHHSPLPLTY